MDQEFTNIYEVVNMFQRTKYAASISLGIMATGFIGSLSLGSGTLGSLLQSGFEAGLVGGLADWFAITALFRHPLGLPIPHTALLPRNRQKVIRSLIHMLENDLLNKASIQEKVNQIRITEIIIQTMEEKIHSETVQRGLIRMIEQVVMRIPSDKMASMIKNQIHDWLDAVDPQLLIQAVTQEAISRKYDEKAFDFILECIEEIAQKTETRDMIGHIIQNAVQQLRMKSFMQFVVNALIGYIREDKLGDIIQNFLLTSLRNLKRSDHIYRTYLLEQIRSEMNKLKDSPEFITGIEQLKKELYGKWMTDDKITSVLLDLQQKCLRFIRTRQYIDQYLLPLALSMIHQIKTNPEMTNKLDEWMKSQIYRFIEKNHSKIGHLVQENLNKLDNETLIQLLEEKVGGELQWIRVNGAVCGFLIGLVLGSVKLLF